ncbi:MAG: YIP1 family protein [Phycisphaerae bacterium]
MNCARCDYLLWELPEARCPECATPFKVTDFAFPPDGVHFLCPSCGQAYLGNDGHGLPSPRRFACVACGRQLDAVRLMVRPQYDGVRGTPFRGGTPWEHRDQFGRVQAFLDSLARLATQPGEYFRQSYADGSRSGALVFSILCAYAATAILVCGLLLMGALRPTGMIPTALVSAPRFLIFLIVFIPFAQIAWTASYGLLIQAVLFCLGQRNSDPEHSVRAVAYGSAVFPALVLLPPVGLLWYIAVVASGVENLHGTSRRRAVTATLVPVLLAANILLALVYTIA